MKKIELMAPAGNWCSLRSAVASGADSVYFGLKVFSMRKSAENFDMLEMKKIMKYLHSEKKKGYLTVNTIVFNSELQKIKNILRKAKESSVDAVICWDMAVFREAQKLKLDVHLSTQAGVSNFQAFRYYADLGAKRVVLARECRLSDITDIAKQSDKLGLPCKIEVFAHGAMCVSISGRCFLSQEAFNKSANRGECLQPCRREFFIQDIDNQSSYRIGQDYILSPKDLCVMPFLEKVIESGPCALKIEGRNRSCEYVKETVGCYRHAIDAYYSGRLTDNLKEKIISRLKLTYNRGLDSGFYTGSPGTLNNIVQTGSKKIYIGRIVRFFPKIKVADILIQKGPVLADNKLLVTGKNTPASFQIIKEMQKDKKPVIRAEKGQRVGIKLDFKAHANDKVFLVS